MLMNKKICRKCQIIRNFDASFEIFTRIDGFFEIFRNTLSKRRKICTKAAFNASFAHSARGNMNCMYLEKTHKCEIQKMCQSNRRYLAKANRKKTMLKSSSNSRFKNHFTVVNLCTPLCPDRMVTLLAVNVQYPPNEYDI